MSFKEQVQKAIVLLQEDSAAIEQEAQSLGEKIYNTHPIIYIASDKEGLAIRFRQQLNENAKILCHHHVVPEMNHNELVGRAGGNEKYSVLRMQTRSDHPKVTQRIAINKEIIAKYTPHQYDMIAK